MRDWFGVSTSPSHSLSRCFFFIVNLYGSSYALSCLVPGNAWCVSGPLVVHVFVYRNFGRIKPLEKTTHPTRPFDLKTRSRTPTPIR
ncbi:hypothetical protein GGR58DRAFT_475701 [Xylaria digitata]|nr:hypothetical protein GGR58DRAFT_475701 [Xylaria digitata]